MKRDWDLIRKILLKLEQHGASDEWIDTDSFPGTDPTAVSYHFVLLGEAGLIKARSVGTLTDPGAAVAQRLTWDGHELLDKIRSDTAWSRVKSMLRQKGVDLSIEAVKLAAEVVLKASFD